MLKKIRLYPTKIFLLNLILLNCFELRNNRFDIFENENNYNMKRFSFVHLSNILKLSFILEVIKK